MAIKYIDQADVKGKRVLVRFDFNVPLTKTEPRTITDSSRIDLAMPTLQYLIDNGASKIIMMSHLGRPDGKPEKKYSLEPVAEYLAEKIGKEVILTEMPVDGGLKNLLHLPDTKFVLLENLRFDPREEDNSSEFAQKLSEYGDIYVNDAFGAAHRKHASVYDINKFFKGNAYGGLLLKKEVESLTKVLESHQKPFVAIIGGAKVSDKIKTIERLLIAVDKMIIGGAMAYPFLKAKGLEVGKSLCSDEDVTLAKSILNQDRSGKITLPVDHIIAANPDGEKSTTEGAKIPEDMMGLDIGPKTIKQNEEIIRTARTVLWNGPMGLFENPKFSEGTMSMARAIAANKETFSLVGGGDSVNAVNQSGVAAQFSHVSTGGGASLEFIEKGQLPGVQALKFGVS